MGGFVAPCTVGRANRLYKPRRQNSIDVSGFQAPPSNETPAERRSRRACRCSQRAAAKATFLHLLGSDVTLSLSCTDAIYGENQHQFSTQVQGFVDTTPG